MSPLGSKTEVAALRQDVGFTPKSRNPICAFMSTYPVYSTHPRRFGFDRKPYPGCGGGAPVWSLTGGGANGSGRMPSSCVRRRFG
jgi:hypothetical protein